MKNVRKDVKAKLLKEFDMNKKNNIISVRIDNWCYDKINEFKVNCTDYELSTSDLVSKLIEFANFCNQNEGEEIISFSDFCNSRTY